MAFPISRWVVGLVGGFLLFSAWPMPVEGSAAFFFSAPRSSRTYYPVGTYSPYYRTPVNPYYGPYSPYADPRVYSDPRSNSRVMNSDATPDYYQQYNNWWQK